MAYHPDDEKFRHEGPGLDTGAALGALKKFGFPRQWKRLVAGLKKDDLVCPNRVPVTSIDGHHTIEKEGPIQIQDVWKEKDISLVEFYTYRGTFLVSDFHKRALNFNKDQYSGP